VKEVFLMLSLVQRTSHLVVPNKKGTYYSYLKASKYKPHSDNLFKYERKSERFQMYIENLLQCKYMHKAYLQVLCRTTPKNLLKHQKKQQETHAPILSQWWCNWKWSYCSDVEKNTLL